MNTYANVPGMNSFVKPKSVVFSLYQRYILMHDMYSVCIYTGGERSINVRYIQITSHEKTFALGGAGGSRG